MKKLIKRALPRSVMKAYENECHKETHINRALRQFGSNTRYIEIGVRDGHCVHQIAAGRKAGVDPAPVDPDFISGDGTELFQKPSDDFFREDAANWLSGDRVAVALVDGLHEFRQALRDVLNLEPFMAPDGYVFIHDCNPPTREHEQNMNGPWNGDVWKVAYYLTKYRPDLKFFTLDCDWGVGVVTGFSPDPPPADEDDITAVKSLDYRVLEKDRQSILQLHNPLYSRYHFSRLGRVTSR